MLPLSAMQLRDCIRGSSPCQPGQVDVWLLSARIGDAEREFYKQILSPAELARAARYRVQIDFDRSVVARGGLRRIIATYCGIHPEGLVFQVGPHGKPSLVAPPVPLEFNISHAGDCVLIGIATGAECGVDIEQPRCRTSQER